MGGDWDRESFRHLAAAPLEQFELKQRVSHVADTLRTHLATNWLDALEQVLSALPEEPDHTKELTSGMGLWPVLSLIERHGLHEPAASLAALGRLTPFWSAEFAVRPYFQADPAGMIPWLERWSTDPNVHRRRLASEGSRPRLPWGIKLGCRVKEPDAVLPILLRLRDDPSDYVRRSVANHLNDIAKDHPELVLRIAADWRENSPQRMRLIRHALRTQIKACDPRAYALLGLHPFVGERAVSVSPDALRVGEVLFLRLELHATVSQRVRIDYALHHRRQNGSLSPKVFHWTERQLEAGESLVIVKKHRLRKVTTRKLYPGEQGVEVRVNGQRSSMHTFQLVVPDTDEA